ncbi:MAG: glycogen/starch synthase [Bacteroidales bacterium]|nr:glycogen/starch synthase [Bacteroidales bacterium]
MKKVLFITQEIIPYVKSSQMAIAGREIPQGVQENGFEIRTFMPRWGNINERRNQLHEVIRLSGLNIIVDDSDHPLIIKVASIQPARMQVYFIDNDDYFYKRQMLNDENGNEYADNTERAVFYARGVLETVKKLRWTPDIIHCHGWISSIVPLFLKEAYQDEPTFQNAKIIFSAYDEMPQITPAENFPRAIAFRNVNLKKIAEKGIDLSKPESLGQLAAAYADGIIFSTQNEELQHFAENNGKEFIHCEGNKENVPNIIDFYNKVCGE